eukprot:scaffold6591_cov77-Cyclotella_meneghiniana.AAC.2
MEDDEEDASETEEETRLGALEDFLFVGGMHMLLIYIIDFCVDEFTRNQSACKSKRWWKVG